MISKLKHHQKSFDAIYGKAQLDTSNMCFPLVEIDKFNWKRGPYGNIIYSYFYRKFTTNIILLLDIKKRQRILNVGCGGGSEEKNLKNIYKQIDLFGIDISHNMVKFAIKNQSPGIFMVSAAEKLPFKNRTFDRIVLREVIEHVLDPDQVFSEVARCLSVGGIAVITTEYRDSFSPHHLYSRFKENYLSRFFRIQLPILGFKDVPPSKGELEKWANKYGLQVKNIWWDGALYHICGHRIIQRIFKDNIIRLAAFFSELENNKEIDRYFCDQIKIVIQKIDEYQETGIPEIGQNDRLNDESLTTCRRGKRYLLRERVFKVVNRIFIIAYTTGVLSLAVLITLIRKMSKTTNSSDEVINSEIGKYLR
ncbi:class I SAM-dependent methyltransferase [Thermodesulfobacteriota bacterium]